MRTCSKDTGALPWAQGHSGLGPGAGELPGDLAAVPGGLPARLLFPCRRRRRRLYGPRWPQRQSGRGRAMLWQPTSPVPRRRIRRGRLSFLRYSSTAGDRHTSTSRCFRLKRWLPGCHSRAEERVSFQPQLRRGTFPLLTARSPRRVHVAPRPAQGQGGPRLPARGTCWEQSPFPEPSARDFLLDEATLG